MAFTTALILFGLLTLIMLTLEITTTYATKGFGYGFSANRPAGAEKSGLALRIQRAYNNQVESASYGVPILAAAAILGLQGSGAETAAMLFVVGRAAFAILYYTGIPFVRVPAFGLSTVSALYIVYLLLMTGVAA